MTYRTVRGVQTQANVSTLRNASGLPEVCSLLVYRQFHRPEDTVHDVTVHNVRVNVVRVQDVRVDDVLAHARVNNGTVHDVRVNDVTVSDDRVK